MSTRYMGYSFYDESLLVRCACSEHFMEIYMYKGRDQYYYGIEWHSNYKKNYSIRKDKCIDFYFKDNGEFQKFIKVCENISEALDKNLSPFTRKLLYSEKSFKINRKNKIINHGYLEITQEQGYINFTRYDNRKKDVWDLCIKEENYNNFLNNLIDMKNSIDKNINNIEKGIYA